MKFLALGVLIACVVDACRSPDYVETSVAQGQGTIDGSRANDYDTDYQSFMLTLGWSIGQQGEAMKNLAALDISKAGALRTETYSGPVVVAPTIEHHHDEEPEEEDHMGTIAASVATLLTLVGAGWWKSRDTT